MDTSSVNDPSGRAEGSYQQQQGHIFRVYSTKSLTVARFSTRVNISCHMNILHVSPLMHVEECRSYAHQLCERPFWQGRWMLPAAAGPDILVLVD